jgi:hypothetical protein
MRLATAACVALLLSASSAGAQTGAPTAAESPTVFKAGVLSLKPMFAVKNIGQDNNVFNEAENPKSDFTMTVAPSAELGFEPGRVKFTLIAGTEYMYFKQYASERGTNTSASLRFDLDLGVLRPYATAAGVNSKDRYNTEVDARARHHDQSYAAGLGIKLFSRTNARIGFKHTRSAFDEDETFRGENLADSLDGQTDAIEGGIGFDLTPLTSFDVNVTREEQRFDHAVERDANSLRIMPTLRFSPAGVINGSVAIGYRRFTALDPRTPDFSGLVASASAGVTLYERHRLDATFNRDLTYSYDRDASYYVATGGSVTWTWLFVRHFDVKASAARNRMRYQGNVSPISGTQDTYFSYSAGAGYRPGRNLRLGITGDWFQRHSQTSAARGFENNRIYGTLTWGI